MKKKILALLVLVCTVVLGSCSREINVEHCEMGIVLPSEFKEYNADGAFDIAYACDTVIVGISRISYEAAIADGISATLTAKQFANLYKTANLHDGRVRDFGDVPYYSYKITTDTASLSYYQTFYKTPYAYFVITFITPSVGGVSSNDILNLTNNVYLILDEEA